ncbi:MAG TPA: tetratricopeptide repeat protein [Micavibrio sp.]|nr:tetratricopeptide repeat protein [Micavibrio sp.]
MTRFLILAAALICLALPAYAALSDDLAGLQNEWARIKYQVSGKDAKLAAIAKLGQKAAAVSADNPQSADAKIWEAIILATDANITKSLSGLPKVEKAKSLLEESLKIDGRAMDGAAHMTLGSLYYQVPGWPVGFGSDDKAAQHLKVALAINPDGLDTNYWYGEFLLDQGRPAEAATYLERALKAPVRANRKVADEGRRIEAEAALAKARSSQKTKARGNE